MPPPPPQQQDQEQLPAKARLLSFDITDSSSGSSGSRSEATELGPGQDAVQLTTAGSTILEGGTYGYDVLVRIVQATSLPGADWWNGLSDPYCIIRIEVEGQPALQYKTQTVHRDLNPRWDEFFEVGNLPAGSLLEAEVWDKDMLTPDDALGSTSWPFPRQPAVPAGRLAVQLGLANPARPLAAAGQLDLEVHYRPSEQPGQPRLLGPVRFRQQLSPLTGLLLGRWADDRTLAFCTFKLFLCHMGSIFDGAPPQPWNRSHPPAAAIFNSAVLLSGVRSQHSVLYASRLGRCRAGVLRGPDDLFALLSYGVRAGQRRYFTYSLCADSMRFSETGATFGADLMSKHAMHAGGAEEVLYAGEFCILPDPAALGGHKLVIDNNSGTYAPQAGLLPRMAQLFADNFPGISVETVAADDPRLEDFHRQCPSRLKAAAAQAAAQAAVAENAADAASPADHVEAPLALPLC